MFASVWLAKANYQTDHKGLESVWDSATKDMDKGYEMTAGHFYNLPKYLIILGI